MGNCAKHGLYSTFCRSCDLDTLAERDNRSNLSISLTQNFHLTPSEIKACDKYFIRYWDARYVFTRFLNSPRFVQEGITYQPIFLPGMDEKYLSMHPEETVRLSFRRLCGKTTGFVLITTTLVKQPKE